MQLMSNVWRNIRQMKKIIILVLMLVLPVALGAKSVCLPELKPVEYIDLGRTGGSWYEIARIPHWYEKGFVGVKSACRILSNGKVEIVNSWRKGSLEGKQKTASGRGKVTDKQTNAKLKITFFWPFYGEYWILEVGSGYEYLVVGDPDRESLWVFSRAPDMAPAVYSCILERLKAQGYDTTKLEKTYQ